MSHANVSFLIVLLGIQDGDDSSREAKPREGLETTPPPALKVYDWCTCALVPLCMHMCIWCPQKSQERTVSEYARENLGIHSWYTEVYSTWVMNWDSGRCELVDMVSGTVKSPGRAANAYDQDVSPALILQVNFVPPFLLPSSSSWGRVSAHSPR